MSGSNSIPTSSLGTLPVSRRNSANNNSINPASMVSGSITSTTSNPSTQPLSQPSSGSTAAATVGNNNELMGMLQLLMQRLTVLERNSNSNSNSVRSRDTDQLQVDRASKVTQAASTANTAVLGLSDPQMNTISQYITDNKSLPTNTNINTNNHQSVKRQISIKDEDSDSDSDSDMAAVRLNSSTATASSADSTVSKVSINKSLYSDALIPPSASQAISIKPRQFGSLENMQSLFKQQLMRCITIDQDNGDLTSMPITKSWIDYEQYIIRLSIQSGFRLAGDYHWRLFDRISQGMWNLLTNGYYCAEIMHELELKYIRSDSLTKAYYANNTKSAANNNTKPYKNKSCPQHPNGKHSWSECFKNPDNTKSANKGVGDSESKSSTKKPNS